MKMIKKSKKAFTLVELVVVIAIIAILSGVSVAVYVGITNNARKSAAQSEATSIGTVVRAAALMDADGYEFKFTPSAANSTETQARAKFLSEGSSQGLQFETLQGEGTNAKYTVVQPTADMIGGLYMAAENTDKLPGKIMPLRENDTQDGKKQIVTTGTTPNQKIIVIGFTYTSNAEVSFDYNF